MNWRRFDVNVNINRVPEGNFCLFDAVFIPTKGNSVRATKQMEHIVGLNISKKIFVIPSEVCDVPESLPDLCHNLHANFSAYVANSLTTEKSKWDLPMKRNFAINFSKDNGYLKILLIDDDIRFDSAETAYLLAKGLSMYWISSCFSIGTVDTSLVGSVAIKCGGDSLLFISGNCLAINLEKFTPFFPDIYNEDWLAVVPAIITNNAVLVGSVMQLERSTIDYRELASFQEFGELIADEIYGSISSHPDINNMEDLINVLSDEILWEKAISDRKVWLDYLQSMDSSETTKHIIEGATNSLKKISSKKCLEFIGEWLAKRESNTDTRRGAI